MIQANELRIGNYIAAKGGRAFEAQLFHLNKLEKKECQFYPIPITEEWLLKFGFIEGISDIVKYPLKVIYRLKPDSLTESDLCVGIENLYLKKIKHVHQLQNLYFALTQKELEL
jgi:hypothetical protein